MNHVYGKKTVIKAFYVICLGLGLNYARLAWSTPPEEASRPMEFAIAAAWVATSLGFVIYAFTARIAISNDSVETGSIFGMRSLRLDQISHRREYQKDAGDDYIVRYIEFIPRDPRERPLKIATNHFDLDTEFRRFVERFPELGQPPARTNASRAGRAGLSSE